MSSDDLSGWDFGPALRVPGGIVPVPAAEHGDPRGARVIVGLPGVGWRADLRGDSSVVQGSRTYIPVLAELEWYRSESERIEVFAPLVPIERVWVETVGGADGSAGSALGPGGRAAGDVTSRLVSLDAPPGRPPVPASQAPTLAGRRVVQLPDLDDRDPAERRDLRAVTEPFTSAAGDICVRVSSELDWYRWAWNGQLPRTLPVPIHLLWLE